MTEPSSSSELPTAGVAGQPVSYGSYLLLERIGSGGMAEVFRAIRKGPEGFVRMFALKRIIPRHAESREFVQMFVNEARLTALLNHPNLVQVYDFGEVDGSYYLAMEFLKGRTALSVMRSLHARRMTFPVAAAAYIGRQVALGLGYAHTLRSPDGSPLNLVHRDINPSNIMLLKSGGVKVLDFGIAKASTLTPNQTQAGLVKGKLSYAAPEQLKCLPLDGRADMFALGVSLWEMLTMQKLFGAPSDFETVTNVMTKLVKPPSSVRSDIPPVLDRVILGMLERDPDKRLDAKTAAARLGDYLREARFLDDSLVELLRELFGDHTSRVLALVPGESALLAAAALPSDTPTSPSPMPSGMVAEIPRPPAKARRPAERERESARERSGRRVTGWQLVLVGIVGLAVLAAANWGSIKRVRIEVTAAPSVARTETAGAPAAPPVAGGTVVVEIDSRPPGATVEAADGTAVGQTPVLIRLARSKTPAVFTVRKPGFEPRRHDVVPERDSMTTLELVPQSR